MVDITLLYFSSCRPLLVYQIQIRILVTSIKVMEETITLINDTTSASKYGRHATYRDLQERDRITFIYL